MTGEKDLIKLVKHMSPHLNDGEYIFASVKDIDLIDRIDTICEFKESEGVTIVIEKSKADMLKLNYSFVCAWITLKVHSSLEAIGLTALFSAELAEYNISCNVIAGYYHDHIFVNANDGKKAMDILRNISS